jgi:hypothetical protein
MEGKVGLGVTSPILCHTVEITRISFLGVGQHKSVTFLEMTILINKDSLV